MNPKPNRLASQKSPYLLQHAENPVDWYPWGEEAFARAKAEDKPIFLSIGYSTCHWCHVMEHESFVDEKVAEILNAHFVSIKVDREERPDVDHVYMTFVQATTGHGGWPMSVWLTPDLKPFFGGTYFAPNAAHGRPSFSSLLERIAEQWKTNRPQIMDRGESLLKALKESEATLDAEILSGSGAKLMADVLKVYTRLFDSANGGFGSAPKFPRCVNQDLLLFAAATPLLPDQDRRTARGMALQTLHSMTRGGIYDHLAGGFHRYSVDAKWHVPHFEKMLYDQAQLVSNLVIAYQLTEDPNFSRVVSETLRYISQDLSEKEGRTGFYSAEDADSFPADGSTAKLEGAFYVWRYTEVSEALGEERWRFFNAFYDLEPEGNVAPELDPHEELAGQNILNQQLSLDEAARRFGYSLAEMEQTWQESRAVLLARRGLRPRPLLDDKVLTSWNGLTIAAFAQAYRVLGDVNHLKTAQAAAQFLKKELFDLQSGELQRSFRLGPCAIPGFATDYAALIHGLIDLYQADFDIAWLEWAQLLQGTLDRLFWDDVNGGYYSTTDRDSSILLRMKEDYDGAEPTPSSLAARNLWRLGHLMHNEQFLGKAKRTVDGFRARLEKQPFSMPLMVVAAGLQDLSPEHVVLHAPGPEDRSLIDFLEIAHKEVNPVMITIRICSNEEREFFKANAVVAGLQNSVRQTTAYICRDYSCQLPVTDPKKFKAGLKAQSLL